MSRHIKNPVEDLRVTEMIAEDERVHIGYPSLFHWFRRELAERFIKASPHSRATYGPDPHKR